MNSGFRYQVARKLWPGLSAAFLEFDPSLVTEACLPEAMKILNHKGKMSVVVEMATIVRTEGIEQIVKDAKSPMSLRRLPWIGAITCFHLAKVLGADVIKPDVHLTLAGDSVGTTPERLCMYLHETLGERLSVIDTVLWRYGEQRKARGWPAWATLFSVDKMP